MLEYHEENLADYVIAFKADRPARNLEDDINIRRSIKDSGATLVSATENIGWSLIWSTTLPPVT